MSQAATNLTEQQNIRGGLSILVLFVIGLVGLGILALIYGDFALVWQPVAPWVPGRMVLAYTSGVLMLACGFGLLFKNTAGWAVRILFVYLIIWTLLKVPALVVAPQMEAVWLGIGEIAVLLAGGLVLFAQRFTFDREGSNGTPQWVFASLTGENGLRTAQLLFGLALIPIGLSHLVYVNQTAELVPPWLPYRPGWAYLTGIGQIACGVGALFSIYPRVAAGFEAGMLASFTLLVWGPAILHEPRARLPWTAFFISWIIAAAAGLIAVNIVKKQTVLGRRPT